MAQTPFPRVPRTRRRTTEPAEAEPIEAAETPEDSDAMEPLGGPIAPAPPALGNPARLSSLDRDLEKLTNYGNALDRFDAQQMLRANREKQRAAAAAEKEARKAENVRREGEFRTRGQRFYTDAEGTLQPELDEEGRPRFYAKKGPVDYSTGEAVQAQRDEAGRVTVSEVDADAEIGSHPDRPHELYRKDKASGWNYLGTVEEGLKDTDDRVRAAAVKAQAGLERDFTATGAKALSLQRDAAVLEAQEKRGQATGWIAQRTEKEKALQVLQSDPKLNEREGGIFGQIGSRPTAAALAAQQKVAALQAEMEEMEKGRPEGVELDRTGALIFNPKQANARVKEKTMELTAWNAQVSTAGSVAEAERARRAEIEAAGGDGAKDPVLTALANRRKQLGMGEPVLPGDDAKRAQEEERLRRDPRFARSMAARDAILTEQDQRRKELQAEAVNTPAGPARVALVARARAMDEDANLRLQRIAEEMQSTAAKRPPADATPEQFYEWMKGNPEQRAAFLMQLSPQEKRAFAEGEVALAQGRADEARRERDERDYEAKGTGGRLWANTVAAGGAASQAFSSLVTAPVRLYGMFLQDGAIKDRGAIQWADLIDEGFRERYLRGREEALSAKVGSVIGSGASFLVPGGVIMGGLRLLGAGTKIAQAASMGSSAIIGSALNGASTIPESVALGMDDGKVWERFAVGAGLGATEAFGVGGLLNKLDKFSGGSLKKWLFALGRETVEEAGQEALQSGGADFYDWWRGFATQVDEKTGRLRVKTLPEILGDTAESAALGAVGGLLFGGLLGGSATLAERRQLRDAAQRSAITPTPAGLELGAQDFSRLEEQLFAANDEQRVELLEAANRSAGIQAASDEIEALQVPGLAPADNAQTQLAARGLVKLATGQPMEALTAQERAAVESPTTDGLPRIEQGKGGVIITEPTLARMRELLPATARLMPASEAVQRQRILSGGEGKAAKPAEQNVPHGTRSAVFEVAVDGEAQPRSVEAADEAEARRLVAADPRTKGMVRSVVQTREATPDTDEIGSLPVVGQGGADEEAIFTAARADIERETGRTLPPKAEAALRKAVGQVAPSVQRWRDAFESVGWVLEFKDASGKPLETAGAAVTTQRGRGARLQFSLKDIVREGDNYERGLAGQAVTEEAIHAVSERLHEEGRINLDGIWSSVPEAVKDLVRGTPGRKGVYENRNEAVLAREFWRLYVQGRLNVGAEGWSVDGKPVVTEQVNPTFLAKIREALVELFKVFRDLRARLVEAGAAPEAVAEIERAAEITLERLKAVDAQARQASGRGNAEQAVPSREPARAAAGEGGSGAAAGARGAAAGAGRSDSAASEGGDGTSQGGATAEVGAGAGGERGDTTRRAELAERLGLPESAIGAATKLTQNGITVDAVFVVQEAKEARPSHDAQGVATPGYDQTLQPRDRSLPEYRKQAQNIAQGLDFAQAAFFPETTTPATTADLGAPVMTLEGDTVIGNGREIGIREAYRQNLGSARRYKQQLAQHADRFGLDAATVSATAQPILKRVIVSPLERAELVRLSQESNVSVAMGSNATELAGQDAGRITPQLLQAFDPEFALDAKRNEGFLRAYVQQAILGRTRPGEGTANEANLSRAEIVRRARAGIFAYAYGLDAEGRSALDRLSGETNDGARKISAALLTVAPLVGRLRADIARGDLYPLDIAPALGRAAQDVAVALRDAPAGRNSEAILGELIDQQTFDRSPLESAALRFLVENRGNRGAIEEGISNFVEAAYAAGNPREGELFAGERTAPDALALLARATDPTRLQAREVRHFQATQALRENLRNPVVAVRLETYGNSDERTDENTAPGDGTGSADATGERLHGRGGIQTGDGRLVGGRGGESTGNPGDDAESRGQLLGTQPLDNRGRDPRLVEAFGEDWPGGWTGLGTPRQAHPMHEGHPLNVPTVEKTMAVLTPEARVVKLGLLPAGTHSRAALRGVIVDYFLRGGRESLPLQAEGMPARQEAPEVMFLGGGGGAGKSSMLRKLIDRGAFNPGGRVLVNADEVRELLPEYDLINRLGDARSSVLTHEESSVLTKEILRAARAQRLNLTYDATMAKEAKGLELIREMRADGYRVRMLAVTIDPTEALVRAYLRGKASKRFVPDAVLLEAHGGFNAALPAYVREFGADIDIFDNSPKFPIALTAEDIRATRFDQIGRRGRLNPYAATINELLESMGYTREDRGQTLLAQRQTDTSTLDLFADYAASLPAAVKASKPGFERRVKKEVPEAPEALLGDLFAFAQQRPALTEEGGTRRDEATPDEAGTDNAGSPEAPESGGNAAGGVSGGVSAPGGAGNRPEGGGGNPRADGGAGVAGGQDAGGSELDDTDAILDELLDEQNTTRLPDNPNARNHRIADGENVASRGSAAKWEANLDAIRTLKTLEAERRMATPEEKAVLARYTGWGWAGEYFNDNNPRYARQNAELRELLTPEEFASAAGSTLNAHYTALPVIDGLWKIAQRLGFKGGRVLEPAGGVGHFFGRIPEALTRKVRLAGVELDSLSGRIFAALYPEAEIQNTGFEAARLPANHYDLAISNVPFGNYPVPGARDYPRLLIHDYFFARSLDKVRPGGLVIFITSDGTLDKSDKAVRALLAEKADLVGAIRLPNNAFAENAGTEVTTDILVLRKRDGSPFQGAEWMNRRDAGTATITGPDGKPKEAPIRINEYFLAHPEMALGEHTLQGSMYAADDYALVARRGQDTAALLEQAIARLPENVLGRQELRSDTRDEGALAGEGAKEGGYTVRDGKFVQVIDGRLVPAPWLELHNFGDRHDERIDDKTRRERELIAEDWLDLRSTVQELIEAEVNPTVEASELTLLRARLNSYYDRYVRRWGTLTKRYRYLEKAAFLEDDPEYPLLQSLEKEVARYETNKKTGREKKVLSWVKADIFTKRTREPRTMPTKAETVEDAVNVALGFEGKIEPATIARLLGVSEREAKRQIIASGRAFENPGTGLLESRERYLSGNVRQKLKAAEAAAADNPAYAPNVEALTAALPKTIELGGIYFSLASRWIPGEVTSAFATELFNTGVQVRYVQAANKFSVSVQDATTPENVTTWGTAAFKGYDLLTHALNGTAPEVQRPKRDASGAVVMRDDRNPAMERDEQATASARAKIAEMQRRFASWVKTTPALVAQPGEGGIEQRSVQEVVERTYNETQNAMVAPFYSGDYLVEMRDGKPLARVPGLTDTVWMNPHRRSVVARILQEGSAVMAHGVGSGKTYSQIVAAMEMRRLGLAKKPLIVVQKATIGQFAASVREAYPGARVLVATEKTFAKAHRRRFLARIATGDYDMVIVTQPQFDRLLPGRKLIEAFFQERLAQLEYGIRATKSSQGKRDPKTKELEAAKKRMEAKMKRMLDGLKDRSDDILSFEQLGVDALLIDEAHAYKKTSLITNLRRVKGVPNDESQRAMGLEMKAEFVQERNNGRNVILATGTPITNSMAESYIMLKLATPHVLKEYGIGNFDDFAQTFGTPQTKLEYSWGGKWKMVTRFNRFVNGSELITMIRSGFDVKMGNKELGLKVPKMMHPSGEDRPEVQIIPQSDAMASIGDWITKIANTYERVMKRGSAEEKEAARAVPIVTMQAGMAAALDPRLVFPESPDDPNSKVNTAVREIAALYRESNAQKGAQVIFADRFKPMNVTLLESFAGGANFAVEVEENEDESGAEPAEGEEAADGNSELAALEDAEFKSAGFNLYFDLREKLVRAGIPREEIAIIHEHNTDVRRAELFEAVNEGRVRVVIGSTEKLGVGVNMQRKLYAAHHLDPPRSMTPAMMEQRDGRIIRQGNTFTEVHNIRYGVERSMDTGIYQMLENKGRFIAQALSGQGVGRTFDDAADELTMSMAEMKALLTGDTRVLRMAELQAEVQELENELGGFENEKSGQAKRRAATLNAIRSEEQNIPAMEAVGQWLQGKFKGEQWTATIGGKAVAGERKDIAEALDSALRKSALQAVQSRTNEHTIEATVEGLPIALTTRLTLDGKNISNIGLLARSPIDGRKLRESHLEQGEAPGRSVLASIGSLPRRFENYADELREKVKRYRAEVESLEAEMARPWERQAEYDAKAAELNTIQKALMAEAREDDAPDPENPVATAAVLGTQATTPRRNWASAGSPAELVQANLARADAMAGQFANIPGVQADDVRQVARIALAKAARGFDPAIRADFGAYAQTVIRNDLLSFYRQRTGDRNLPILDNPLEGTEGTEDDGETGRTRLPDETVNVPGEVASREAVAVLRSALGRLPARMREAITLQQSGEDLRSIGASIGLSHEGARKLIAEGHRRLRASLGELGVRGTGDLLLAAQAQNAQSARMPEDNRAASTSGQPSPSGQEARVLRNTDGSPRKFYHGSASGVIPTDWGKRDIAYFTPDREIAGVYTSTGAIAEVHLELQNPLTANNAEDILALLPPKLRKRHRDAVRAWEVLQDPDIPDLREDSDVIEYLRDELEYDGVIITDDLYTDPKSGRLETHTSYGVFYKWQVFPANPESRASDAVRMSAQAQSDADPFAELLALLDTGEIDARTRRAEAELPGMFQTGRPELSYGTRDADTRAMDDWRLDTTEAQSHAQWEREARALLAGDYEGFVRRAMRTALTPGGSFSAAETKALRMVIAEESARPRTPEQLRRVQALIWADRQTGMEQARGFGARRDLDSTPEERHRLFLAKLIYTPPAAVRKQIEEAATAAEKQRLLDADTARLRRIEEELEKMGVSLEDILSGEVLLGLKGSTFLQNRLGSLAQKEAEALRLLQGGQNSFEDVAKRTGLTAEQLRRVKADFLTRLKADLRAKVQQGGLRVDRVDLFDARATGPVGSGGLAGAAMATQPQRFAAQALSEAETEAELEKIIRAMGFVEDAAQGKMRTAKRKRKALFRPPAAPYTGPAPSGEPLVRPLPSEFEVQTRLPMSEGAMGRNLPRRAEATGENTSGEQREFSPGYGGAPGDVDTSPTGEHAGRQTRLELPFEEWMYRGELGDPAQVARIARLAQAATGEPLDMAYEYWINAILSGPQTQTANVAGNALNAAWDFSIQRGVEALLNLAYRDADAATFGEFRHLLRGVAPGLTRGLRLAARAWSAEADFFRNDVLDQQIELFEDFEKGGGVRPAIPGKAGRVIRMPGRALLFMDSLFKGWIGQMEAGAQAYRIARREALKGDALEARMRELINTPGSEAWQRAVDKAEELTFQTPIRTREEGGGPVENLVARLQHVRRGSRLLSFFLPFVRTPFNIFRTGLRKSPLGSLAVLQKVARGLAGIRNGKPFAQTYLPAQQVRDLAEQSIAWTTMALIYGAVQGDEDDEEKRLLITGSLPPKVTGLGERLLQERAFGGDYQIRIGGRNGFTFAYGRYEPLATVLGTTVDAIRQLKQRKPAADRLDGLFGYFLAQAQAKTFLQGLSTVYETATSTQGMGDFARKTISQALVPNLLRQPLRNLDDHVRDAKRAPVTYQMLPVPGSAEPRIDPWGEEVEKAGSGFSRLFIPSGIEPDARLRDADRLLLNWAWSNPAAAWAPSLPSDRYKVGEETVKMTAEEYRRYSVATGRMVAIRLGALSPGQVQRPTHDDVDRIKAAFEDARRQIKLQMFGQRKTVPR